MLEEIQIESTNEELRWKETLTINAFYWSEGREGGRRVSEEQSGERD